MNKTIIICAAGLIGIAAFAVSRHVKTPPKEPNDNAVSAKSETAAQEPAFLPFGEASNAAKIAQYPVTNAEYARFVKDMFGWCSCAIVRASVGKV